jgi:hypothetical protein
MQQSLYSLIVKSLILFFISTSLYAKPDTLLIPLYSYPNWWDEDNYVWKRLIDAKNQYPYCNIIAIINPNNGDFNSSNSDFEQGIKDLKKSDIHLTGYVYTSYGDRNDSKVKANIDAWQQYYQSLGIEGIFFDEVSTDPQKLSYYQNLTEYTRSKGFSLTILNPGITTNQTYIDSNISDIVITYENAYEDVLTSPPTDYNTPSSSTELAILIHQIQPEDIQTMHNFTEEHNFSGFYYTEDGADGNPWDTVTSSIDEELKLISPSSLMTPIFYLLN